MANRIPDQRTPHHDHLEHPSWCSADLCQLVGERDVVHAEVPDLFVTEHGDVLTGARRQDDELVPGASQTTYPHDLAITTADGTPLAMLSRADLPRFAAWVLARGRSSL